MKLTTYVNMFNSQDPFRAKLQHKHSGKEPDGTQLTAGIEAHIQEKDVLSNA